MIASNPANSQASPFFIEGALTLIVVAMALVMPRLAPSFFRRIECAFLHLARRRRLAVFSVGLAAFLLRLIILPFCPIPVPFAPDDFSFLLAADTFLHGRLTNPTPAMWVHLETIHVTMVPTYASMYFPGQGLLLAAGILLFGHAWYALLISSAVMCAAICWMLQAWLPPRWALLGGIVAVLHLGLFSYWVNTYHAAGTLGAIGGALILGSLPRLKKTGRMSYGLLMALGMSILILSRPFEGMLLSLPVAFDLGRWAFFGKKRLRATVLLRRAALPMLLIISTVSWLGYYDYRAFGSPTTLPYTVDRAQYASSPYFIWQSLRPEPAYRHEELRRFYFVGETDFFLKLHTALGFPSQTLLKATWTCLYYSGFVLLLPLIMLRRVFMDRRVRFLLVCLIILAAGMFIQIFIIPHYTAAFTSAFYAIGLQAMRHLRLWKPVAKPVGLTLVRLSISLIVVMVGVRLNARPLHLSFIEWPSVHWNFVWYGPNDFGLDRAKVESSLQSFPGKQLAIVRYSPKHYPLDEWVYNSADIDGSKVIWAREMDAANNEELLRYYQDRKVWLIQPDAVPEISLYPAPKQPISASR